MINRLQQYPPGGKVRQKQAASSAEEESRLPDSLVRLSAQITTGISKYPAVTLGTGLVIGAWIGWFIKRR